MFESKIVAILPNSHLMDSLEAVQRRRGISFATYHKQVQEALVLARESIRRGIKVVISRGLTAEYLRTNLDVPVVEIEYDFFQFAEAMRMALRISDTIAVIGFVDSYHLAERAVEFVRGEGQTIHVRILETSAQVEDAVRELAEAGAGAFVGGNTVVRNARAIGLEGVYVEPDEKVLDAALEKALYELRICLEREEKLETIQAIVNCATNGIFAVDSNGVVSVANPLAQKHLKMPGHGGYPVLIKDVLPGSKILETIRTGQPASEDFITIGNSELIMTAAPVVVEGRTRGAVATIQEIGQIQDLDHKIRKKLLHKGHSAQKRFSDIIGESETMMSCKRTAMQFAAVDSTVLILGKTGTGKEIFAQSIHTASRRSGNPFVAVNCATLPASLLESELFGYAKGAFTGARTEGKAGIFELAHTGTIFLDEIGEISLEVQARLLRVVQEREITRIGDDKVIPVDVRILAASNKDLRTEVREHRFREDLYYRLSVLELRLPDLKDRREDIPFLVKHFVRAACASAGRPPLVPSREALAILGSLPLDGNVRELCNIIEKTLVLADFGTFDAAAVNAAVLPLALSAGAQPDTPAPAQVPGVATLVDMEREMILRALGQCQGNRTAAARRLGISSSTLWRRLKEFGICP